MDKIVYHGNCTDGVVAREIALFLFPNAVTQSFVYQDDFTIGPNEMWVDASPNTYEQMEAIVSQGGIILDHHATRYEMLHKLKESYPDQVFIGYNNAPIPESGAWLTYKYVRDRITNDRVTEFEESFEEFAKTVATGDTFRKDRPEFAIARSLAKMMMFYGNNFEYDYNWYSLKLQAEKMIQVFQDKARTSAERAIIHVEGKARIAFLNTSGVSDAADYLISNDKADIVVGWTVGLKDNTDQIVVFYSIRTSEPFGPFAIQIAKANGGGGHLMAHGFTAPYIGEPMGAYLVFVKELANNF